MLQAESEKLRQAWIQAVQASIASAYKDITGNYYIGVRRHRHAQLSRKCVVSNKVACPCSVWTGQPHPPLAALILPVS